MSSATGASHPLRSSPRDHLQVVRVAGGAERHRQRVGGQRHSSVAGGLLRGQLGTYGGRPDARRMVRERGALG